MGIQISKITPENILLPLVLRLKILVKLTVEDYEALVPEIEKIQKDGQVRMLVELFDFHGWTVGAVLEDTKFSAREFTNVERIAIVGDKYWARGMSSFCKPFKSAIVRYYDFATIEDARKWIFEKKETTHPES